MGFETVRKRRRKGYENEFSGVELRRDRRQGQLTGKVRVLMGADVINRVGWVPDETRVCVKIDRDTRKLMVVEDRHETGNDFKLMRYNQKNANSSTCTVAVSMEEFEDLLTRIGDQRVRRTFGEINIYNDNGRSANIVFSY